MTLFRWVGTHSSDNQEYDAGEGFTDVNVGGSGVDITFNMITEGPGHDFVRTENDIDVYDAGGTVPNTLGDEALYLTGTGNENGNLTSRVELLFNDTGTSNGADVDGAEFYITDLDVASWDDQVTIFAYDAAGNAVRVYLTSAVPGNHILTDANNASNDPADGYSIDAVVGNTNNGSSQGAVLVQITAPISRIVIDYGNADTGGQQITISNIEFDNALIPCLTRGTLIKTAEGVKAIEDLAVGDLIETKDNGTQAIRWIGSTTVRGSGKMAPINFSAGSVGNDRPLKASPNHRMLIQGWRAELLFGTPEVLVAAKHLTNGDTIFQADEDEVEYFHVLFDDHQIIFAEGAPTESFNPGGVALNVMDEEAKAEILELFPQLATDPETYGQVAVTSLRKFEAKLLMH